MINSILNIIFLYSDGLQIINVHSDSLFALIGTENSISQNSFLQKIKCLKQKNNMGERKIQKATTTEKKRITTLLILYLRNKQL